MPWGWWERLGNLAMRGLVRYLALGAAAAGLAACSGYSPKSDFTLPSVNPFASTTGTVAGDKATVMFASGIEGLSCAETHIVLAQADGDGFRTVHHERIDTRFGGGAGAAVLVLDPGTYHVVALACRNGANVVHAGTNPKADGVPWQSEHWTRSLATFSLASGEVLDAGELILAPQKVAGFAAGIDGRKANLTLRPSSEAALAEIVHTQPDIAPKLHTRWMQLVDPNVLALAKCHLEAPKKALPHDGSSKLPDVLNEHPEAAPVVKAIGTATTDAESCRHMAGLGELALPGLDGAAQ